MADDHEAPEARQFPRSWIRGHKEIRVTKERAVQGVCNWTVQNEMRSVLEQVPAGAAGWILDSANSKEMKA